MWKLLVGLMIASSGLLVLVWLRRATDRALVLRRAGFALMAVFTVVGAGWIAAETFTDAVGWRAAGLVAAWLVPLVVLLGIAWYRTDLAVVLLSALIAVAVGIGVWGAIDPEPWRAFENDNGPIRAIVTFVLAAPIALLGWTRAAGLTPPWPDTAATYRWGRPSQPSGVRGPLAVGPLAAPHRSNGPEPPSRRAIRCKQRPWGLSWIR